LFLALLFPESLGGREFAGGVVGSFQRLVNAGQSIVDVGSLGVDTQAVLISPRRLGVAIQFLQRLALIGERARVRGLPMEQSL
jgi:hypothetical protein